MAPLGIGSPEASLKSRRIASTAASAWPDFRTKSFIGWRRRRKVAADHVGDVPPRSIQKSQAPGGFSLELRFDFTFD